MKNLKKIVVLQLLNEKLLILLFKRYTKCIVSSGDMNKNSATSKYNNFAMDT